MDAHNIFTVSRGDFNLARLIQLVSIGVQDKLGIANGGLVYAVYDYEAKNSDELTFKDGDTLQVLRKSDDREKDWWWSRSAGQEGYVARNLLGVRTFHISWSSLFLINLLTVMPTHQTKQKWNLFSMKSLFLFFYPSTNCDDTIYIFCLHRLHLHLNLHLNFTILC